MVGDDKLRTEGFCIIIIRGDERLRYDVLKNGGEEIRRGVRGEYTFFTKDDTDLINKRL